MKISYAEINMRKSTLALINTANKIIEDFQRRGYELTLRQLYYQLVSKDIIPNTEKSYKKLGNTISNGRIAGLVDWDAIVDRTRERSSRPAWSSPNEIIESIAEQYRIDKWEGQEYRVFVWVEKEALAGVVATACIPNGIQADYLSCRGYMSQSTIWREAQHLKEVSESGQIPIILHLGDHDPSGIDMTRDNIERLAIFSGLEHGHGFLFRRIALNYDQVKAYNPPPNPAKLSDSRVKGYIANFGKNSWELDALDPDVLVTLIQDEIGMYQDQIIWEKRAAIETAERAKFKSLSKNWR